LPDPAAERGRVRDEAEIGTNDFRTGLRNRGRPWKGRSPSGAARR
jgi:hypothetical protein